MFEFSVKIFFDIDEKNIGMSTLVEQEEALREAACNGDIESLGKLLEVFSVDINSTNKLNGWTALHWASKRNHKAVVEFLLKRGANKELLTIKGEQASNLTSSEDILGLLGGSADQIAKNKTASNTSFTPNYLANPVFPYTQPVVQVAGKPEEIRKEILYNSSNNSKGQNMLGQNSNELVLKIRVAYLDDRDFIEVEMDKANLTFEALKSIMCKELGIERRLINKIRKLPNTILRKDKDVERLCDFQELEVILTNKIPSGSTNKGLVTPLKNQEVLY